MSFTSLAFIGRRSAMLLRRNVNLMPKQTSTYVQRQFCNTFDAKTSAPELTDAEYEKLSNDTLNRLAEFFDELGELHKLGDDYDVQYAYGVLKVYFNTELGTYIINRQAPNKQLWLSSPQSGPKRYDFLISKQQWIYKHDGVSLHDLLSREVSEIVKSHIEIPFK